MQKCAVKGFKTFPINLCKMDQGMEPCVCNYHAARAAEQRRHLQTCKLLKDHKIAVLTTENATLREQIIELRTELRLVKASKQSEPINKRPREEPTATINPVGKETYDHISEAKFQELLGEPRMAVYKLSKLVREQAYNKNVRVGNVRDKETWEWFTKDGWQPIGKKEALEELFDQLKLKLQGEAGESTDVGKKFERWCDQIGKARDEDKQEWKEQLANVVNAIKATR